MAHSNCSSPEVPPVFQPARDSGGPVVWRPLAESFNIVKTSRAPGGGFTVYQVVIKVCIVSNGGRGGGWQVESSQLVAV